MTTHQSYVLLPGAGSAGHTWRSLAIALDALILPIGDQPRVASMAEALLPEVTASRRPRVVIGASLGAMVAIEIARRTTVDALVLIGAGWGITVDASVLEWVESDPPDLLAKLARIGLAPNADGRLIALREADFAAGGGQPVLLRHLRALSTYRPEPVPEPPRAIVLWGEHDRGVPLSDHASLATQLGGLLVPISGSGHAPFLERPSETARWGRRALAWASCRQAVLDRPS